MTVSVPTLSYAGPPTQQCPLCHKRQAVPKKAIYGHPVCKKCFYAFANRRQLAFVLDAVIFYFVIDVPYGWVVTPALVSAGLRDMSLLIAASLAGILPACLFLLKDGFNGRSLGKLAANVVVLDEVTGQPIGFGQSFKRHLILLIGQIPFLGWVAVVVVELVIAVQVARGYRLGDRFASTKVIWKKYAHLPVFGGSALVCQNCGYDLMGNVSGVCPECGTAVSDYNKARLEMAPMPASRAP